MKIKRICQYCGKEFLEYPCHTKIGKDKFCSKICYYKSKEGKKNKCKVCKKQFYVRPFTIKKNWGLFCSRKCQGIWARGRNNPHWKGGITSIYVQIRNSLVYRLWRNAVFLKDNFTCQECGDNKGGNLRAHHLKKYSPILIKNKINTFRKALNCKELWDIKNGITLCIECHKKIHKKKENIAENLE